MLNNTTFKSLIAFSIVAFFSCNLEESTNTKSLIINNTSSKVRIVPYYQGAIVKEDSVKINSNEKLKVLDKNERGKGTGFSYPLYLAFYDSVIVVFDNSIQAIHYSYAVSGLSSNPTAIKHDSSRSLFNEANYVRTITQENKRSISNEYTFTFTAQDYLDAKK